MGDGNRTVAEQGQDTLAIQTAVGSCAPLAVWEGRDGPHEGIRNGDGLNLSPHEATPT